LKILVVGCGRVGGELAYRLFLKGHQIVVVDIVGQAFENLPGDFHGRFIEGHALNEDVLVRAGIEQTDALAAVTSSDMVNAVVAQIAIEVYRVPSVVVRNFDSRYRGMHEMFDAQIVSSSSWGAQRIEELLYQQKAHTVFSAGNGEVELYEFMIDEKWDGKPFADLLGSEECLPVALTRIGRAMLPDRTTILKEGDVVLVSATLEGSEYLHKSLETNPIAYSGGGA
jgi:trk system potassium uptake protein TrkA